MTIDELAALIAAAKADGLPGDTPVIKAVAEWDGYDLWTRGCEPVTAVFEDVGGRKVLVID